MANALVTIVVTPRDRFCFIEENLETIFKKSDVPFEMIYIDGGSPDQFRDYLVKKSAEKKFKLIRVEHYLSPNQARNLAVKHIKTPFAAFVENDVSVADGWLSGMLSCAQDTGCAVVCPITCQDKPIHENIHYAGGEMEIKEENKNGIVHRFIKETKYHRQGSKHFEANPPIRRGKIGFTEVHAFLVRTDILNKISGFDEGVMSTRDHVDFSLNVKKVGGEIYMEPKAIVTFMGHFTAPPLESWEEEYYRLRWSDTWEYNSLTHLSKKWNLTEDRDLKKRFNNLGWRRRVFVIKPKIRNVKPRVVRRLLEEIMVRLEKMENKKLAKDFAAKYGQGKK
ncbi:MAG: glycosyltransferase [Candidatus Omnitrophica bacterium]|nr:glycosyltransferase [Candidatus Omnitrophota bacterium]